PSSPQFEVPDTPFVAADPSIERIVDEEETAAVNGEMFKDARLQERIFDQIHAVEFNIEDDFSSAEVGSLLSSGFGDESFERIDDGESDSEPVVREGQRPREAHVSSFVDDVSNEPFSSGGFQRISDEEEEGRAVVEAQAQAGKKGRKPPTKKRAKPATATKTAAKKKAASKKPSKKRAAAAEGEDGQPELYADSAASLNESSSRGEFATRRGGRRRRRPSKNKPSGAPAEADISAADGQDDEVEQTPVIETQEEVIAPPPERKQREHRDQRRDQRGHRGQSRRERYQPAITDLLSEGQEILVQIAKEPIAKKGARITSHIALPGRFLVYMPTVEHVGVSRKIESDSERHRLRKLIQTLRAEEDIPSGGFIVRTAGVGISEKELREDVRYLVRTWLDIRGSAEKAKAPALV